MNLSFYMPTKIIFGQGAMEKAQKSIEALGSAALIITGRSSAKKSGALKDAVTVLEKSGIRYELFDEITANPLLSSCQAAGQKAREMKAEFLLAIGGGSVLDAAKAAAFYATNPTVTDEAIYEMNFAASALPIVAVGITAGTGSEVSPYAVLTVDRTGQKRSISHRECFPALAVSDPTYTHSMSMEFTVSTALDALSHSVEGWFSPRANDLTDAMAGRAIPLLWSGLCQLENVSSELEISASLRETLFSGSLFAGLVLNHCSTGFPHPLGYPLTEEFDIPHGKACATFLPALAQRGADLFPERGKGLCDLLGASLEEFQTRVEAWTALPSLPVSQSFLDACYARWETCKNFLNSPGGFTREEAVALLKQRLSK